MAFKRLISLTEPGAFVVGCNYWASHAGTHMWRDWRPDVVESDLRRLAEGGIEVIRVFPLWPDFQPITELCTAGGGRVEFRHGENPLPDDDCGQAGMSAAAMAKFGQFLGMMDRHGIRCIVGLLTGWMSGRLFLPPALERLNVLTDPIAMLWEIRFVRHFVSTFRDHKAIAGWDLGNECNCMGSATREQAYTWTATIANTIRACDQSRPVVSGLHGLTPQGKWTMQDQGELTDLLTIHPYPPFTPHCDQDPVNTIRTIMHSAAESRFYADIAGKPCLCQEIGTLGPMNASESIAADFARSCLFSLWANDCHGLLWWCANDQTELGHAPYDWSAVERELGLLRTDGSAKPVLGELGAFKTFLESLPFAALPERTKEAVCIITSEQDQWGAAYSSFILAKEAGFDIEFQYSSQPIKQSSLYLMPSVAGSNIIPRRRMNELLDRVRGGATLYVSLDSAMPSGFEQLTGLEPQTQERRTQFGVVTLDGLDGQPSIPCSGSHKVCYVPTRATVLGTEEDGNPAFTVADYGKGKVFFLSVPIETTLSNTPGGFHSDSALPCWQVYRHVAQGHLGSRVAAKTHPMLALTEHELDSNTRVLVLVNQSPHEVRDTLTLAAGWEVSRVLHGSASGSGGGIGVAVEKNDAMVLRVTRTTSG